MALDFPHFALSIIVTILTIQFCISGENLDFTYHLIAVTVFIIMMLFIGIHYIIGYCGWLATIF